MEHLMHSILRPALSGILVLSLVVAPVAYAQEVPADTSATADVSSAPTPTTQDPATPDQVATPSVPPTSESTNTNPTTLPVGSSTDTTSVAPVASSSPVPTDVSSSTVPDQSTPSTQASTTTTGQPVDLQGSTASVQDTTNTQQASDNTVLESTVNPETATDTESTVVPVVGTTTATDTVQTIDTTDASSTVALPVDTATSSLDVVSDDINQTPKDQTVPDPQPVPVVVAIPDAPPKPEFTFALTGKQLPSKRVMRSRDGRKTGEQSITAPLQAQVDNTTGVVSVSGQCSDTYFVVLLYKNQNDYVDDPSSYIVNRAYPCVNGTYSYAIADLPKNLANGQYYLLVGQEGEKTTWTPITGLTEITISTN